MQTIATIGWRLEGYHSIRLIRLVAIAGSFYLGKSKQLQCLTILKVLIILLLGESVDPVRFCWFELGNYVPKGQVQRTDA